MAPIVTEAITDPSKAVKEGYSIYDSFCHWWNRSNLEQAEHDVLALSNFYPETDGKRIGKTLNVVIDDKDNYVHEFNVKNIEHGGHDGDGDDYGDSTDSTITDHIVLIHGYGAALGLFFKNFEDLTERPGTDLHALDLLGYGLSSRPRLPEFKKSSIEDVLAVEDFFVESIENWRKSRKIEKFHLIGHSFGGYLSSLYTLKYPNRVSKLVLISPVGVERSIYDLSVDKVDTSSLAEGPDISEEIGKHYKNTDEPSSLKAAPSISKDNQNDNATDSSSGNAIDSTNATNSATNSAKNSAQKSSSLHVPDENGYVTRVPNLPKVLTFIWNNNLSPFTLVRFAGPLGPKLATNWSFRRFGNLKDYSLIMKLHIYSYSTFVGKGSGEYALTRILAPGALARYPLLNRLPGNLKVDSLWLYGEIDWMSKEAGATIVKELVKTKVTNNMEMGKETGMKTDGTNVISDFEVIKDAGHHVYLDNPKDFKDRVYKFFGW